MSIRRERAQREQDEQGFVPIPGSTVKVKLPEGLRIDPVKATTEAKPKPPQPDDPRTGPMRDVPPYAAG